jgi:hypothetical protein
VGLGKSQNGPGEVMLRVARFVLVQHFFVANAFISLFRHTNNAYYGILYTTTLLFPSKSYTLAGFEPGFLGTTFQNGKIYTK